MKIGSTDISAAYLGSTALQKVYVGATEVWSSFTGLLDTYTGAAAAYSLRLLSTSYTGSAIKVRRASDNTEQDIGFSNNELDTTTLASFCSGTNGFVTTWYDQSGNGRNATQTTAANQPKVYDSSTGVITENGKPSLKFDGSNDYLKNTTSLTYSDFSLFGAFKFNSYNLSVTQLVIQYSKLDIAQVTANFQSSDTGIATITSYSMVDVGGSLMKLHTHLTTISGSTTTSTLYLNGSQKASGTRNLTSTKSVISIGATDSGAIPINANMSEFILYPTSQSSNKSGIETNINSFYSIY